MKKLLKVYLILKGEKVAICDYLELNPFSASTAREFTFHKLRLKEEVDLQFIDKLSVQVLYKASYNNTFYSLSDFDIIVLDYREEPVNKKDWHVYGIVDHGLSKEPYSQGVVDIINTWQNGKQIDWFGLPVKSYLKQDYISACFYHTSIRIDTIIKEVFEIDMSEVKVYKDILYLLSEAFFGEKGYMGHNFQSFADCLLILFNKNGHFVNKKIIFKKCKNLVIFDDIKFFDDVVNEFLKYKFTVIVEP